jgi:hypothetical protein
VRARWIVIVCVGAGFLCLPIFAYGGFVAYAILTRPDLAAAVQGCPSHALPVHPGSKLGNYAEITVGSDTGGMTTGCWAMYKEPSSSSVEEVFDFYAEPGNVAGWTLDESYANTGYLAFRSTTNPSLRADVEIDVMRQYFAFGRPTVTYAISVCLCDPRSMAQ